MEKKRIPLAVTIGGHTFTAPNIRTDLTDLEGVVNMIADLLSFAVGLAAVVAVVMIIYGGYLFITSAGDPDRIASGGKALTAAVVGLIIVFLARTVIVFLLNEFLL